MECGQLADLLREAAASREVVKVVSIDQRPALAVGENYLSDIYRLKAVVQLADGRTSTRWFILKKAIADNDAPILRAIKKKIFNKELLMYNTVFREIEELMAEFHDTSEKYWCKLYGCKMNDLMLFQDLKASGYGVGDRCVGLSLLDCTLAMRTLGRYHAATRVLTDRGVVSPDMIEPYGPLSSDAFMEAFFVKSIRNLCQVMAEDWGPEWKDVMVKLDAPTETIISKITEITRIDQNTFNTLLHADYWVNNIMFRHDEDGYPIAQKMIDFQLYGYAPEVPSFEELIKQMTRHRIWALVTLIYFHSFISSEEGESMDIIALVETKGEKGHNKDVFRRPHWREMIGDELRALVYEVFQ